MDLSRDPELDTLLQHYGEEEKIKGAVTPPIFQNSLFVFEDLETFSNTMTNNPMGPPYHYSRTSNPTVDFANKKIAMLEHADECQVYGTGMAAITAAIMSRCQSGSHVVCLDTCYGPVKMFLDDYLPRYGVTTTYVDGMCPESVLDAIRPETTLAYLESPSSIIFRLQDLETITKGCREKGVTTIMDNSYSTPIFQTPIDLGIDMVVHSATKYLGGHSDITAGVVAGKLPLMENLRKFELPLFGGIIAPFPAWLLLRGLRTLHVRMNQHQVAGNHVANWLEDHAMVERVFHPGLASFPQKDLYRKQMRGSGGLISFEPKFQTKEEVTRFRNALNLYQLGVSWGGFESLSVPLQMHPLGWSEPRWVIRLYCGLEDPRDMVKDLEVAFAAVKG